MSDPRRETIDPERLERARRRLRERLLAERTADGHWRGELSTSALSTATATFALRLLGPWIEARGGEEIRAARRAERDGLDWLARNANGDGGWGDTPRSRSNISTTALAWAALGAEPEPSERQARAFEAASRWLERSAGSLRPEALAEALSRVYGEDRTFSVPILTMCALAGRLGEGAEAWRHVMQLPLELAALPRAWFPRIGLPVVSYALPALIAIGLARHARGAPRHGPRRWLRERAGGRVLGILEEIQPDGGGFLEAVPLTSFVAMGLAGSRLPEDPCEPTPANRVLERAVGFLLRSRRENGSWPIDTDLATWLTTLSIGALSTTGGFDVRLEGEERERVRRWLLDQQYDRPHPYTGARPGGWAWTDLSGGVPDADDTAGALLALAALDELSERSTPRGRRVVAGSSVVVASESQLAAAGAVRWLLELQNRDGGIPTFCRGWGKLPFDRSGADLTAHALRALVAWRIWTEWLAPAGFPRRREIDRAIRRGVAYLASCQRCDGSWLPLWFGSEHAPDLENPLYGTARVLRALEEPAIAALSPRVRTMRERGLAWLLRAQGECGGWGGAPGTPPSIEETGLALDALAAPDSPGGDGACQARARGSRWLLDRLESGGLDEPPAPIGFYFARLWYSERLYPVIFALGALERLTASSR